MNSSRRFLRLAFLPICITLGYTVHAEETYVVRLPNPDASLVTRFLQEKRDIASYVPGKHVDLVASAAEFRKLSTNYRSVTVLETSSEIHSRLRSCRGYQNYDQMLAKLQSFEKTYPQLCKLYDIGDSRGKEYTGAAYGGYKHEIWAMKVTGNVAQAADKPKFYFMGEHHAREPASMEVCMAILEHFLSKYASDPAVADRVNKCELWFVPLVNPNGHKVALLDKDHSMWRKNIRDNDNDGGLTFDVGLGSMGYTDGVDLNRNYDYKWGTTGVEDDPLSPIFPGPSAGSEPEIKAVTKLMSESMFVAGISYHLYSELVLWPYGYEEGAYAPDSAALGDLGRKIAARLPKVGGGTYTPEKSSGLYPCSGTTDDYAYGTYGTFSFTIELFDASFYPDDAAVEKLKKDNLAVAMELVNRVTYSTLTGTVTSGAKSPVEAVVYVKEIDDTVAAKTNWRGAYMTDKAYGRYHRLLMPGTYTVTFRPKNPALKDTTIAGVKITNDKVTTLDIAYGGTPVLSMNGTAPDARGLCVQKMPGGLVRIALPAGNELRHVSVYSAAGTMVRELHPSSTHTPATVEWDTKGLARGLYVVRAAGAKHHGTMRFVVAE